MKRLNGKCVGGVFALAVLAASGCASAARATVFEYKWVAGQRLSYDVSVADSHLNLSGSKNAPMLPMGMPLNVDMTADGAIDLDTQSVADDGTGIVAMRVPKMQINGSVMTFQATLKLQDGKGRFLLNGKEMGDPNGFDAAALTSPQFALKIGKNGEGLGFVPIAGAKVAKDTKSPMPFDIQSMMQNSMMNTMPQLWPDRDIKTGESWSVEPKITLPGKTTPSPLGKIDLKFIGDEKIAERNVQRVSVAGEMNLNREMLKAMPQARRAGMPNASLDHVKQVVNGDIWFDAAAGQIVRAVMKIDMQSAGSGEREAVATDDEEATTPRKWTSSQAFDGTLRLTLREVSTLPDATVTATAPKPADAKTPAADAKAPVAPAAAKM